MHTLESAPPHWTQQESGVFNNHPSSISQPRLSARVLACPPLTVDSQLHYLAVVVAVITAHFIDAVSKVTALQTAMQQPLNCGVPAHAGDLWWRKEEGFLLLDWGWRWEKAFSGHFDI